MSGKAGKGVPRGMGDVAAVSEGGGVAAPALFGGATGDTAGGNGGGAEAGNGTRTRSRLCAPPPNPRRLRRKVQSPRARAGGVQVAKTRLPCASAGAASKGEITAKFSHFFGLPPCPTSRVTLEPSALRQLPMIETTPSGEARTAVKLALGPSYSAAASAHKRTRAKSKRGRWARISPPNDASSAAASARSSGKTHNARPSPCGAS